MAHMPIYNPNFTSRDMYNPMDAHFNCLFCSNAPNFPTFNINFTPNPFAGPMFHIPTLPMLNQCPIFHDSMPPKWNEKPEAYVLRVDIPAGLKKEEVEMKLEGNLLKVSGRKHVKKEEKKKDWHHYERSDAQFMNAVSLPENCRPHEMKSSFENGVFTVTVPKRDAHREAHFKNIQVKGSNYGYNSH